MATFAFASVADHFGVGTSVGAYPPSTNPGAALPVAGAALVTAAVQGDGTLTFQGLDTDTAYVAYDAATGRRKHFRTQKVTAGLPDVRRDFGGKFNGVADDSQAWVDAAATGLSFTAPGGVSMVQAGALQYQAAGQRFIGTPGGRQASAPTTSPGTVLRRIPGSNGKLISGGATSQAARRDGVGLEHIVLHGSSGTGELLETDYCVHGVLNDVWMMYNADAGWRGQEVWDWSIVRGQWEQCSGTAADSECVVLSNSSSDSTNAINFYDPRFETFRSGFLNLKGSGFNMHGVRIEGGKAETAVARGDLVKMTADVRNVILSDMYIAVDAFDAGFSTPVNIMQAKAFADLRVRGMRIRQNSAGLIRAAFACQLGGGGGHSFEDVLFDNSAGDPTVGIFSIDGGTSDFDRRHCGYQAATALPVITPNPIA